MKNTLTGILSGLLLFCVLIGNAAVSNTNTEDIPSVTTAVMSEQGVRLPVLMYHHILKQQSRWGDYVISPEQFESDLLALKQQGYTTVSTQEVLDYMEQEKELPEKPILITFDDGYESFYEYAFPILQKQQMKASLSIIGKYTDLYSGNVIKNVSYSHANWDELREMKDSGLIEFGNHSYELHENKSGGRKGIKKLSSESAEEYKNLISRDITALNEEITKELSLTPNLFAYPFGASSKETDSILKDLGFRVVLTCEEKVNMLKKEEHETGELMKLMRFNRPSKYSTETVLNKIK